MSPAGRLLPLLGPPGRRRRRRPPVPGHRPRPAAGSHQLSARARGKAAILPALQCWPGQDHAQGRASRVTCDALRASLTVIFRRIG